MTTFPNHAACWCRHGALTKLKLIHECQQIHVRITNRCVRTHCTRTARTQHTSPRVQQQFEFQSSWRQSWAFVCECDVTETEWKKTVWILSIHSSHTCFHAYVLSVRLLLNAFVRHFVILSSTHLRIPYIVFKEIFVNIFVFCFSRLARAGTFVHSYKLWCCCYWCFFFFFFQISMYRFAKRTSHHVPNIQKSA